MSLPNGISSTAMVLAAGLGTRMRPLSLRAPKPLLKVGGRSMLDLALDKLKAVGVQRVVVNAFYLAEQIEAHAAQRRDIEIVVSRETERLDTGGGIKWALPWFGNAPFFALNADLPWIDAKGEMSLQAMARAWEPGRMDQLLLVMQKEKAQGFTGRGDFMRKEDGRLWRSPNDPERPYVWISAQIAKPELFEAIDEKIFSNNKIFDLAQARGALYGIEHLGTCYHAGTPEDLARANRLLETGQGWG